MYVKFVSYSADDILQQSMIEVSEVDTKELAADGLALAQILVTTRKNGVEQTHSLSNAKEAWHTCFVMNAEGKTIDRIFAPAETNDTLVEVAA